MTNTSEALARYAHDEAWSGWMQYMFRQGTQNADGSWTMPAEKVTRWRRQMATPFDALPEAEQTSDYEQAAKIQALLPHDDSQAAQMDEVYADRNQLAMLAGALAVAAGGNAGWATDPEAPGWPVLIIDLPDAGGQVSWHVPAQQATQFDIGLYESVWDGHTTSEKRKRIAQYLDDVANAQVPRMRDE